MKETKQNARDCEYYFAPMDCCKANKGTFIPTQPYICNVSFGGVCKYFKNKKQKQ